MKQIASSLVLSSLIFLSSCTTYVDPATGQQEVKATKTGIGAGVGALAGAFLGGAASGDAKGALIGGILGAGVGAAVGNSMDQADRELNQSLANSGMSVQRSDNQIRILIPSDITFNFDDDHIKPKFYRLLRSVADVFRKYPNNAIIVSGFTDNVGKDYYNQDLSERRAQAVANCLVYYGVSSNHLFVNGYGQRHPIASNATGNGRKMNRRVEIVFRAL